MSIHISDRTTRKLTVRLQVFSSDELSFKFDPTWKDSTVEVELGCQKVTMTREEANAARRALDRYLKVT